MFYITENDIIKDYNKIKRLAQKQFALGHFSQALKYIELGAKTAYQANIFYCDDELEMLYDRISQQIIQQRDYIPVSLRVVFYDVAGQDNRGLTQQYLRALMSLGFEILYILEHNTPHRNRQIFAELQAYSKAHIHIIDQTESFEEQIISTYNKITEFRPSDVLMHLFPWDVVATSIFCKLKQARKFQINLTDHAFWLGKNCSDYIIEFRNYGAVISRDHRHIAAEKLLHLPYYPIEGDSAFQSLPYTPDKNQVLIFTGGSLYKTMGRDGLFYQIIKNLLDSHAQVILFIAGDGPGLSYVKQFIRKNHFEKRIHLLGNRRDINHIFDICDIYLGTYPMCGGLMTQYAAMHGKPILAYSSDDLAINRIEQLLYNLPAGKKLTYDNLPQFYEYADKLITDKRYRENEGQELSKHIISTEAFTKGLKALLERPEAMHLFKEKIDCKPFCQYNIEVENLYSASIRKAIIRTFGVKSVWMFPKQVAAFITGNILQ